MLAASFPVNNNRSASGMLIANRADMEFTVGIAEWSSSDAPPATIHCAVGLLGKQNLEMREESAAYFYVLRRRRRRAEPAPRQALAAPATARRNRLAPA